MLPLRLDTHFGRAHNQARRNLISRRKQDAARHAHLALMRQQMLV
jgi:hypothetical protein